MSAMLPAPEAMLRALVATPSVSSPDPAWDQSNRAVVDRLAEWADGLGFRVEVRPLSSAPHKANLLATLGQGEGGLVLSGHTDTVPYDEASWATDPFDLVERGGAYYGLGTADMKGFFAAALHAVARFEAGALRRPVMLLGTADEESGMDGIRDLLAERPDLGAHAVIGEPTSLTPVRQHKGVMMERLVLEGRAGHASDPSLGNSALEGMADLLLELRALREELVAAHTDPAFSVPNPTLNFGRIEGGDSPNRICAHCRLDVDLRFLPGMSVDGLRAALGDRLDRVLARRGLRGAVEALVEAVPAFETPAGAKLVRALEELTGRGSVAVPFATEGPYLNAYGVETVVLGPGSITVAHQPDEHLHVRELDAAADLYAQLIHRFCVEPS